MPSIRFDRFYRYQELSELLRAFAAESPGLASIESIGRSHEGRDIWLLTVTNRATGEAADKPAFWVDGNIHSTEVAASVAAVYFLKYLLDGYGKDPEVTRALDTRAFYVCPRINPDGAEWALADKPKFVRSSTRSYPYEEDPIEGLTVEDVDGDGRILQMRIPDPNGLWKPHPQESRLMVRRDPAEVGGRYYRILPEGRLEGYDGFTLRVKKPRQGLDLNRNFPGNWRQEYEQLGAGPFPTSEPEVRAVAEFVAGHPNIMGGVAFHTWAGVLLRPFDHLPDTEMHAEDLWHYQRVGNKGTELTGYPAISVYHEFRYHPKQVIGGAFDWIYDHFGMFSWVVEIWSPMREAGIEKYLFIDWFRDHPTDDDLKIFRWSEEKLGGKAHVDWKPFQHPDLGAIEIGGWNRFHAFGNPPLDRLEGEVARFPKWLLWQALLSPRMELVAADAVALGAGTWRVRLVVQNTGWLPSYVSKRALERKVVRGVIAEIALPRGAELASGKRREELGQLEGKAYKHTGISFWPDYHVTDDRAKVEWVVRGKAGDRIELIARHERAGAVRASVVLE
ncbi:MAG TPA: M14 family metallopeptidase [Casimicrobiaceae bacterium]|nr:M14 family metallopeptidase [Casimicrobiaceae bacterium]